MKQDNHSSKSSELYMPVVVLTLICLVASALLGLTNSVTAPIIEEAALARAEATRMELLPEATGFSELETTVDKVRSVYVDDGGSGYVISVTGKGYKGDVPVTVGLSAEGEIIGVEVNASGETASVGSRAGTPEFTERFKGLSGSAAEVDVLTGASVSSRAVINAVEQAFAAYEEVKEG